MATFSDSTSGVGIGSYFNYALVSPMPNASTWTTTATEVDINFNYNYSSGQPSEMVLGGAGFVNNSGTFSGTISSVSLEIDGVQQYTITGLSLSAAVFASEADNGSYSDLTDAIFAGNDTFNLTHANQSIEDDLYGGTGNDTFNFGAKFSTDDQIDGGTDSDTIVLNGKYAGTLDIEGGTYNISNVEKIVFKGSHSYNVDNNSGSFGNTIALDASALAAKYALSFRQGGGSANKYVITGGAGNDVVNLGYYGYGSVSGGAGNDNLTAGVFNGANVLNGGDGNDTLTDGEETNTMIGGTGNDVFQMINGGTDKASGGAGNDKFFFDHSGSSFTFAADGGTGVDTFVLEGSKAYTLNLGTTFKNIEHFVLSKTWDTSITTNNTNVAKGKTMTFDAHTMSDNFTFKGSAEKDGHFTVTGGRGNDALTGGHQSDHLLGGDGQDTLNGGAGNDVLTGGNDNDTLIGSGGADHFVYTKAVQSDGYNATDTVSGFDAKADTFDLWFKVARIDKAVRGSLSSSTYTNDLKAAITAHDLGKHHAVLFTPSAGDYKGEHFLVIDANGVAGYQPGKDLVILLDSPHNLTHLSVHDFT